MSITAVVTKQKTKPLPLVRVEGFGFVLISQRSIKSASRPTPDYGSMLVIGALDSRAADRRIASGF